MSKMAVGQFCDQLKARKIVITSEPDAKPWAPKSPAECHLESETVQTAGDRILLRVGRSDAGCKKNNGECADAYCEKDLDFSSYSIDLCRNHFTNAIREECYGKGFGEKDPEEKTGMANTYGGSFFTDCMMWSIVALNTADLPGSTDGS